MVVAADPAMAAASMYLVEYEQGDKAGKVLAYISLLPMHIVFALCCVLLVRRELHLMTFIVGQLLNEVLNNFLKHTIKEPRPEKAGAVTEKYGMPSSHSQFMGFFVVYAIIFLFFNVRSSAFQDRVAKVATAVILVVLGVLVCYSRVYLHYHTELQVACGVTLGVCVGVAWYLVTHNLLKPMFGSIENWQISQLLLVRDSTPIDNLLKFEYDAAMVAKRKGAAGKHPAKLR